jgi:hypothetical protein
MFGFYKESKLDIEWRSNNGKYCIAYHHWLYAVSTWWLMRRVKIFRWVRWKTIDWTGRLWKVEKWKDKLSVGKSAWTTIAETDAEYSKAIAEENYR